MHPANARRIATLIGAALPFVVCLALATRLEAQTTTSQLPSTGTARVIEWDIPQQDDIEPGSIVTDLTGANNRLWFVTRIGIGPRVYRLDFRSGKKVNNASWFSWDLDSNGGLASGLRRIKTSKDGRFVFVRTTFSLQRIDTGGCTTTPGTSPPVVTCPRTVWDNAQTVPQDPSLLNTSEKTGSDLAIDDNNNLYTAVAVFEVSSTSTSDLQSVPQKSFIERLSPGSNPANVVRWYVGGGAGACQSTSASGPCLSGVAINPRARDLVYYSEPVGGDGTGAIGELDPSQNVVRRWFLSDLNNSPLADPGDPASEPRQIRFDSNGILWAITGSGHLISLDPRRNVMSKHATPGHDPARIATDPFGIAPDGGVIGYTDSSTLQNNVAMLFPKRNLVPVTARIEFNVVRKPFTTAAFNDLRATQTNNVATPHPTTYTTVRTPGKDGTFVEADSVSGGTGSMSPTGITPDLSASVGTFFFAIGDSGATNRIGRIRLPRGNERARVERDDDDFDDDGKRADVDDDNDDDGVTNSLDTDNDNDGTPDAMDDDDDNDGIEDSFDTKDKKESKQTSSQDLLVGESALDQFSVNPGTLLAVVSATSTDLLAPVTIEILNEAGQVVASGLAAPGAAVLTWIPPASGGLYTLRVKNTSAGASTISTKILTRELWPL